MLCWNECHVWICFVNFNESLNVVLQSCTDTTITVRFQLMYNFADGPIFSGGSSLSLNAQQLMTFVAPEIKGLEKRSRVSAGRYIYILLSVLCWRYHEIQCISTRLTADCRSCWYKTGLEPRWWYYAAAAVSERNRRQLRVRRGGRWSWIQAPTFYRWFPRRRESPPVWPGPLGLAMTAAAAQKTTRSMWVWKPR